jgi:hypothetical protein
LALSPADKPAGDSRLFVAIPTMTPPTIASTAAITITPVRFGIGRLYRLVINSHL